MALQVVRPVDNLERYNVTRSNVNIYNNVCVGISIHSPVTIPFSRSEYWVQLFLNPLTSLIDLHPILATVIGDHLTGHPVFLRLKSIDLLRLIRVVSTPIGVDSNGKQDNVVISKVLEEEHNKPFDLADHATPLWRLVVVPTEKDMFHLIYTFHHVIGDGRSAMSLTEQFVEQLNRQYSSSQTIPASSNSTSTISIDSDKPIPASIESRVNCYPSIRYLLWEVTRAIFLPGFLKKALETKYWAGEIDSSLDVPNQTEVGFLRLTQDETQAVVRLARARGTTVQAIMYTSSIFAIRAIFMPGNKSSQNNEREVEGKVDRSNVDDEEALVFATPCSLRNLIPSPIGADEQGNYVSEILHDNIRIQDGSGFWAMTDQYRKEVVAGTTTPKGVQHLLEHFGALALLSKQDGAWESFMTSKVTKDQHGRKASIKLSNLGRGWDNPASSFSSSTVTTGGTGGLYTIQDGIFSQSSGVTASALTMSAATANGRLSISTTWQTAAFYGRERGEAFVSEFKRILLLVALKHADTPELSYLEICPRYQS
ncbi:hypothetical protein EC991_002558 [Linnemannia zychae]|nr:hypothetical protein EC991_002558 [Linnemannia zychae]